MDDPVVHNSETVIFLFEFYCKLFQIVFKIYKKVYTINNST